MSALEARARVHRELSRLDVWAEAVEPEALLSRAEDESFDLNLRPSPPVA